METDENRILKAFGEINRQAKIITGIALNESNALDADNMACSAAFISKLAEYYCEKVGDA